MIDKEEHFTKKYHPFAWFSSINDIKWKPLDIPSKAFDIPGTHTNTYFNEVVLHQILLQLTSKCILGTLVSFKGMLYVLAYPNSDQILGYQVKISNTTLLTSIMPEGGVRSCEVVYGSDKQHCNNDHDFVGYIRGFGLNSISATTIIE